MNIPFLRSRLYDYIRIADEKKIHAIYDLLENEIEDTGNWWENEELVNELDLRYEDLESGKDKGVNRFQIKESIDKLREEKYGK